MVHRLGDFTERGGEGMRCGDMHAVPCVAVFGNGLVAEVKPTIVVTRAVLWKNTAIILEDITMVKFSHITSKDIVMFLPY